jgi:succinyl-CoA synthetase beta subunit
MGTKDKVLNKAYVADLMEFVREDYIAILINRNVRRPILIICTESGVNIKEIANKSPENVQTIAIDNISRLQVHQIENCTHCEFRT